MMRLRTRPHGTGPSVGASDIRVTTAAVGDVLASFDDRRGRFSARSELPPPSRRNVQPISDDATLAVPLSVPQRSRPDSRFESSLPSHFARA
jgi:hypothetical protein